MTKKHLRNIILIVLSSLIFYVNGQDFHYSMNQLSPLNLNPALTGWHKGDIRINSNHRSQWASVSAPFNTYSISTDFTTSKFIPLGILINQDIAGDSKFSTLQINLSSSFNLINDSLQQLRIGFQGGYTSRSIDVSQLSFDAQYNGSAFDPNLDANESFNNFKIGYGNINTGLMYVRKLWNNHLLNIQLSCFNLNRSDQSFMAAIPPIGIDIKFLSKFEHEYLINNLFKIKTSIFTINQGAHKELLIGSQLHYTLADLFNLKRALWTGLYYRNNDAFFFTAGVIYDAWKLGLSYDINLSELVPASQKRGGFEIALIYLFTKKIKMQSPILICPDYL